MHKSQNISLVRYEYIVYIHLLKTHNVNEILLTMDDFDDAKSQSDHIKWIPVENIDIDIIDFVGEVREGVEESIPQTRNRICGLFDAEPLDWKYARIMVGDDSNTKHNVAIAKMPRSPIVPVIFDVIK
jgi:hypothetical protein